MLLDDGADGGVVVGGRGGVAGDHDRARRVAAAARRPSRSRVRARRRRRPRRRTRRARPARCPSRRRRSSARLPASGHGSSAGPNGSASSPVNRSWDCHVSVSSSSGSRSIDRPARGDSMRRRTPLRVSTTVTVTAANSLASSTGLGHRKMARFWVRSTDSSTVMWRSARRSTPSGSRRSTSRRWAHTYSGVAVVGRGCGTAAGVDSTSIVASVTGEGSGRSSRCGGCASAGPRSRRGRSAAAGRASRWRSGPRRSGPSRRCGRPGRGPS